MFCRRCRRTLAHDAVRCPYCGDAAVPGAEPKAERAVRCPACRQGMVELPFGAVVADLCQSCGGLWFDGGELARVLADAARRERKERVRAAGGPPPAAPSSAGAARVEYRHCPRCGQMMQRKRYSPTSDVVIDMCGGHGVFLDRGELERIEASMTEASANDAGGAKPEPSYRRPTVEEALDAQKAREGKWPRSHWMTQGAWDDRRGPGTQVFSIVLDFWSWSSDD